MLETRSRSSSQGVGNVGRDLLDRLHVDERPDHRTRLELVGNQTRLSPDRLAHDPVTLLFAVRDETHNNAAALKEWLDERAG
jgi:hypothetical protein